MSQRQKKQSAYEQWRSATVQQMKSDRCLGPVIKRYFSSLNRGSTLLPLEVDGLSHKAKKTLKENSAAVELCRNGQTVLSVVVHLQTTDETMPRKKLDALPLSWHKGELSVTHNSKLVSVPREVVRDVLGDQSVHSMSTTVYHYKITLSVSCTSPQQITSYLEDVAKAVQVLKGEQSQPKPPVSKPKPEGKKRSAYVERMLGRRTPVEPSDPLKNIAAAAALYMKTG